MRTILSLCDHSGEWSRPYAENGYRVIRVDLQDGQDVRLLERIGGPIHGILCAPPCDHFASSGARWWKAKGEAGLLEGLAIVDACLRQAAIHRPAWWALENPKGRLGKYLGPATWRFNPCDFGDPYTKLTYLWGHFTPPPPLWSACLAVEPELACPQGSWIQKIGGSGGIRTKNRRSVTPAGFARAFFMSNK